MNDKRAKRSAVLSTGKALKHTSAIQSFGVNILFKSNSKRFLNAIPRMMDAALGRLYSTEGAEHSEHSFEIVVDKLGRIDIYEKGKLKYIENTFAMARSRIEASVRLKVAEYAVGKVFIHSGAVAWKGNGVILPARSFNGKSTLTAALVRLGALYFSDEYAIIDNTGRLHPFPKDLSLRGRANPYEQVDHSVESIGGRVGKRPVPVKLIVLTSFDERAKWRPKRISKGQAVLGVLNNAVGIRRDPSFVLPVITKMCGSASAFTSKRGHADETARRIIEMIEEFD